MTKSQRGIQLTVQGWQYLVLAVMGIVVFAGAVAGSVLLNRTDELSRELIDDIQPSRVAAYRLQGALGDQETATRGYAISADRQFLDPYYTGQQAEDVSADAIRQHLADRPDLLSDVEAIQRAAERWRSTYAEPLIASINPGSPGVIAGTTVDRGKSEFDGIRSLFEVQNQHLLNAREDAIGELDQARGWRDGVLVGMIGTFLVMAIVLAILVRSAVTRPLEALAEACQRITEGNFYQRITPHGPKDIRRMATDVENMRQRIVDELEAAQTARDQLDEQTVELRRSNAELEQFAYVASHDLQEPLRKVASFCQLLEKRYADQLDERGVEYIGFAVDGAKRMQVLINDLLTFSRVGRPSTTKDVDVDLGAALDVALGNLSAAVEESGAAIVRPAELPTVVGDPTLLAMLWQNLIGNAIKFRREGVEPRIVLECEPDTGEGGDHWVFSLTDNGIGIDEEFVDKVFVIFQRLHGRDVYGGTGIGLALCKKIVEFHGGTIWIDTSFTSSSGGTCFRFTLPVKQPAAVLEGPSE
ncbi:HAMP domain-containing protein [Mycolicibacterium sp. P9-64]|uniref:sensor histidine kinase n=1 Tax=Mycolicibacterium sp. P9-64 TaxID=2024612 RepID=UPI0011EECB61|nr:sensor histidine kinase [Mycolicibacterium sp. P9-64]KAA0085333.1 HAMP domain-containing protein [Mycolicibacterium sp. P9-64]